MNATVSKNTRNSNLELLRINAMFLIVLFHCLLWFDRFGFCSFKS